MEYAEFEVEYKRVTELIMTGRIQQIQPTDIARLRNLAAQIDDEDDREDALLEISGTENILANHVAEGPLSEVILEARRISAEGNRYDGTLAERLARAEEAFSALDRLPGATWEEEQQIGALGHTLAMVIEGLRDELR
ncbi:MAG TPA: hypothetical protein VFH76_23215 [Kribbella sp.]|nr:hypothetical protein [Kribbella sp.]